MRTLPARARFPARMRGRSTRERDFRRECDDAPRESAIFSENARTFHARARFQRECEDAPRGSTIFGENARTLHARTRFPTRILHRGLPILHVGPPFFTDRLIILLFYYFSTSTVTALANKNARTLHARARFRREYEDAPRESAISGENVRTLHARARFPARM